MISGNRSIMRKQCESSVSFSPSSSAISLFVTSPPRTRLYASRIVVRSGTYLRMPAGRILCGGGRGVGSTSDRPCFDPSRLTPGRVSGLRPPDMRGEADARWRGSRRRHQISPTSGGAEASPGRGAELLGARLSGERSEPAPAPLRPVVRAAVEVGARRCKPGSASTLI